MKKKKLKKRFKKNKKELKMTQKEIDNLQKEAETMLKKIFDFLRGAFSDKSKLENELKELESRLNETKAKLEETENKLRETEGDLEHYKRRVVEKLESQQEQIKDLEAKLTQARENLAAKESELKTKESALEAANKRLREYESLMCKDLFNRFCAISKHIVTTRIKSDNEREFLLTCANVSSVESLRKAIVSNLKAIEGDSKVCDEVCGVFNEILEMLANVDSSVSIFCPKINEKMSPNMEKTPGSPAQGKVAKVLLNGYKIGNSETKAVVVVQ